MPQLLPLVPLADSRKDRVYIAGPMTGIAEFNFPAFNAAAAELTAQGLTPVNPADHGLVEGAQWDDYLRYDIAQLATCEAIYFLPGWTASKGARLEHHLAMALGMTVRLAPGAEPVPAAEVRLEAIPLGPYRVTLADNALTVSRGRDLVFAVDGDQPDAPPIAP